MTVPVSDVTQLDIVGCPCFGAPPNCQHLCKITLSSGKVKEVQEDLSHIALLVEKVEAVGKAKINNTLTQDHFKGVAQSKESADEILTEHFKS